VIPIPRATALYVEWGQAEIPAKINIFLETISQLAALATSTGIMQLLLSSVCMALTSAVIGFAYYQKQQFYPAVVYITKSNASMGVSKSYHTIQSHA